MRRPLLHAALALTALLLLPCACAPSHSLRAARPIGPGRVEAALEVSEQHTPIPDSPLSPPYQSSHSADLALRFGSERGNDVIVRAGLSGVEAGIAGQDFGGDMAVAFGGHLSSRIRVEPVRSDDLLFLMDFTAGLSFQWDPHEQVSLVASPVGVLSVPLYGDAASVRYFPLHALLMGGVRVRPFGGLRIGLEAAWMPIPLSASAQAQLHRSAYMVQFSFGWTTGTGGAP